MAVIASTSLVKVKADNDREDARLVRRLGALERGKAGAIEALHKEKCELLAQLRAHRSQELRSVVRETLLFENRKRRNMATAQREETLVPPVRGRHLPAAPSRGFSKVSVADADDPDGDRLVSRMRETRRKSLFARSRTFHADPRRKQPAGSNSDDERDAEDDDDAVPGPMIGDDDVFLYYPVSAHGKPAAAPYERSDPRSYIQPLEHLNTSRGSLAVTLPALGPPEKLPSYVPLLSRLREATYDEFTDGTMALEMRRFHQRKVEKMPTQTGHLPVRPRYSRPVPAARASPAARAPVLETPSDGTADILHRLGPLQARAFAVKHPATLRFYFPKEVKDSIGISDVQAENDQIQKLRKAEQTMCYRSVLRRSATFLEGRVGAPPTATADMVRGEALTREETLMLETIQEGRRAFVQQGRRAFVEEQRRGIAQLTKLAADGKLRRIPQAPRPPAPGRRRAPAAGSNQTA